MQTLQRCTACTLGGDVVNVSQKQCEQVSPILQRSLVSTCPSVFIRGLGLVRRFVMLIDSPVFTRVRLQLLSPERYPDLMRAMYSLLMLCPQSRAFHTLHARLSSIPTLALLKLNDGAGAAAEAAAAEVAAEKESQVQLPWAELLQVIAPLCMHSTPLWGLIYAIVEVGSGCPRLCMGLCVGPGMQGACVVQQV